MAYESLMGTSETFRPFSPFKDKIAYFVTLSLAIASTKVYKELLHWPVLERPKNIKGMWTNFYSPTAGILRGDILSLLDPLTIKVADRNIVSIGSHSHYWTDAKVMEVISLLIKDSKRSIFKP